MTMIQLGDPRSNDTMGTYSCEAGNGNTPNLGAGKRSTALVPNICGGGHGLGFGLVIPYVGYTPNLGQLYIPGCTSETD